MLQQPIPLDPSDLVVTSFETESTAALYSPIIIKDPTAATRCFYCPIEVTTGQVAY